ncbi:MAG: sugar phosphate nucleotidyltransferase, partial [Gemmatimonadaceae bacterium]
EREVTLDRVRVHFAIQAEPRGTADAVAAAAPFAGHDNVLVLNSDNYYPPESYHALASLGSAGLGGFSFDDLVTEGNIPPERVRHFALAEHDEGWLTHIIEKPDEETFARLAPRASVSMNLWSFTPRIFDACALVRPSARGELELQDAVRVCMEQFGERFRVVPCSGGVLDLSSRQDIAAVKRHLDEVRVSL